MGSTFLSKHNDSKPCSQISRGLSIHAWPSGHAIDSEETIQFTELQGINCMVQTFPLEKANEAYGKSSCLRPSYQLISP